MSQKDTVITVKDIYQYGTKDEIAFLKEGMDLGKAGAISISNEPSEPPNKEETYAEIQRTAFPLVNRLNSHIEAISRAFKKFDSTHHGNIPGKIKKISTVIDKLQKHLRLQPLKKGA